MVNQAQPWKMGDAKDARPDAPSDGDYWRFSDADGLWLPSSLADYIDGSHLSQDFGASSARLNNIRLVGLSGNALDIMHAGSSVFSAVIAGAPSSTEVVYDGEANENMLKGLLGRWARVVLHNTTRGNSRKITAFDETTNTITTEDTVDDWADNDVITCQSQTNESVGYFDVDLSDSVPATLAGVIFNLNIRDISSGYQAVRRLIIHPYEAYDAGKRIHTFCDLADETTSMQMFAPIISQAITMKFESFSDVQVSLQVVGQIEYADT